MMLLPLWALALELLRLAGAGTCAIMAAAVVAVLLWGAARPGWFRRRG